MMNHPKNHSHPVVFDNRDIARYAPGERRMAMRGFEAEYTDIVDYIVRITHRIWEEKEVGYIYDTYQHNCVVHGSMGDSHGREGVVAATLESLAAFPERRIYADDVIWAGNEDDGFHERGYHVAVRWTLAGTHLGHGYLGAPSGARVRAMCLSQHRVTNGIFTQELTLPDEMSVRRQIAAQRMLA